MTRAHLEHRATDSTEPGRCRARLRVVHWFGVLAVLAVPLTGCVAQAPLEGAACDREHPCPGTLLCLGGTCRALETRIIARCFDDNDCGIGVCLAEFGFCVQCAQDADCGGLMACIEGAHVCGCTTSAQCATGRCDAARATCVGCYANEQCESGLCDPERGICRQLDDGHGEPEEKAGGRR